MYRQACLLIGLAAIPTLLSAQGIRTRNNTKQALNEVLSLYKQYDIVCLGERHGSKADHDFRVSLVQHPAFPEVVDDIVIESGNHLYQELLDDYVMRLHHVPDEKLRKIWRNTLAVSGVWDSPIYRRFLEIVREVNAELPPASRLRVIAGDPPIDWAKVQTSEAAAPFYRARCEHPAKVIASEVLSRKRKALVIYGAAHFYRSSKIAPAPGRLRAGLETLFPGRIFTIQPLGGDDDFSRNFQQVMRINRSPVFISVQDSKKFAWLQGDLFFPEARGSLSDFTDGVLYFGTQPGTCIEQESIGAEDEAYREELARRKELLAGVSCQPCRDPVSTSD